LDTPKKIPASGLRDILVLKTDDPSLHAEIIAHAQREWLADISRQMDRPWEEALEKRHMEILPDLIRRVEIFQNWGLRYTTTREIDRYFDEWGQIYLRRMWSHDLIGPDEKLGGNEFRDYLGLLAAISGRSQKHLCFAGLLKHKHPRLDWRNLLTTFSPFIDFLDGLARHLDADRLQLQKLLSSLTLEPTNRDAHLLVAETAWAPLVRSNQDNLLLPAYGLEINPFLFLLRDLQYKYPGDWFEIANNRERRWRASSKDPLHQSCELSELNLRRIRASKPGGSWRDWDDELVARCHRRTTGKSYPGVYGRMAWNAPAPTMTTQYFGFGSGRFGHPSQARGISLREGAILQSFPRSYRFVAEGEKIRRKTIGRLVGNAVPVKLAEVIGKTILVHAREYRTGKKAA
jgi:hypothetical protein